jgi:hypothetical protein
MRGGATRRDGLPLAPDSWQTEDVSIRKRALSAWSSNAKALASLLCATSFALASFSCGGQKDTATTEPIDVLVTIENGVPLANAQLSHLGVLLRPTGPDGVSHIPVPGSEGAGYVVDLTCPDGFRALTPSVTLQRLVLNGNGSNRPPQYAMSCKKLRHTLVVAIRTNEIVDKKTITPIGGLPIVFLGKELSYTDPWGARTLSAELEDGEHFDFTVGTPGKVNANLHPQNPIASFVGHGKDEIVVLDQTFTRDKAPKTVHRGYVHRGPVQL